jgi:hypothetical protein
VVPHPSPQSIDRHPVGVVVWPGGMERGNQLGDVGLPNTVLGQEQLQQPRQLRRETENLFDLNELSAISHCYIIDNTERLSIFHGADLVLEIIDLVHQAVDFAFKVEVFLLQFLDLGKQLLHHLEGLMQ